MWFTMLPCFRKFQGGLTVNSLSPSRREAGPPLSGQAAQQRRGAADHGFVTGRLAEHLRQMREEMLLPYADAPSPFGRLRRSSNGSRPGSNSAARA
jgi:hypothetical protein